MASKTNFVDARVMRYIGEHSVREPQLLAELRAETAKLPEAMMQVPPEQGQFLALLIQATGAKRCIEVGTFTGYSALAVALALPGDGKIICCDVSEEWTGMARRYWKRAGVEAKIDLRIAPALQTLDGLLSAGEAGRFDFMFIDADKPAYREYFERGLKLVRQGGIIAFDNTLWSGAVADPKDQTENTRALRELNDALHRDERVSLSLLPLGDGVTLALKR
jgi:predicted O-methyltransferase YrrM